MISSEIRSILNSYTNHPKFGKLLSNALDGWKTTEPGYGVYGVKIKLIEDLIESEKTVENDNTENDNIENNYTKRQFKFVQYYSHYDCVCCLVGASLINKSPFSEDDDEPWNNIFINCQKIYDLSEVEVSDLICGFDDSYSSPNLDKSEAYNFAYSIGKIIFDARNKTTGP